MAGPRRRRVAVVESANDRYIFPQKYRDKMGHVGTYSSLQLLAEVRGWLSINEQAIFKGTAIGHLLSVPADSKFSGTILHFLLSRQIHMNDKPDEMRFKVGGKVLHFGKREFALTTGLSFRKSEKAFVSPKNPPSLMRTYFPNPDCMKASKVNASKVKALLSDKNSTRSSLDRVKLALLLCVHHFLMGRADKDSINISYWHLVDDLDEFNKYPWGEGTFDRLIKCTSTLLSHANEENNDARRKPYYRVFGIAQALVVWALDIMPGLLHMCGRKIESTSWQPHMLCVLCTQSPHYTSLISTLDVNDDDENQLVVLGLEAGTPESSLTENERHEYHGGEYSSSGTTTTSTSVPGRGSDEEFEIIDNMKIPADYAVLYRNIFHKYGHIATKKVIKDDAMLLVLVTSLLKIISDMETKRGAELSEALLDEWEGYIKLAETSEFNIRWLREGFDRLKNQWASPLDVDSHERAVLDAMQVKHCLLTRMEELETELSEVKIQINEVEMKISCEQEAIQEKQTRNIKFQCEPVIGVVLN